MKVKISEDMDTVNEIRKLLKESGGYCPCALTQTADTKCMCKDFRENIKPGETCHCGLYIKVED